MKKAILFDYGGTLDTDGIHWFEKFYEAYHHFRVPIVKENLREAFVYAEKKCSLVIEREFGLRKTLKYKIEFQLEYLYKNFYLSNVYDFIIDEITEYCYLSVIKNVNASKIILESLSSTYKLGIISNYYGNLETELEELSLKKYFKVIIDSAVVGVRKPDLKIFEIAINQTNALPSETIVIGDSYEKDISPAKLLGCFTIWINNKGWSIPQETKDADLIIKTIMELPDALTKTN
ncbi:HAD family hydrolase [Melioribacteraceae bacterium 4301-Me]|uniref:HAD family hydrolase n=1 Tax=Pyranulibacter aquaticus TaxID=3163344 RepID=UPI0035990EAA